MSKHLESADKGSYPYHVRNITETPSLCSGCLDCQGFIPTQ